VSIAAAGQSGTSTITVDARNGFSGSVSFACTAPTTAQIACSVSGSPITFGGGTNSGTATLTITTTAAQAGLDPRNAPLWLGGGALLAGVFMFGVASERKRWRMALTLLMLAMVISIVGCSGSSGSKTPKNPGTPAGSYTVTVTASSTNGGTTTKRSTSVSVTVL